MPRDTLQRIWHLLYIHAVYENPSLHGIPQSTSEGASEGQIEVNIQIPLHQPEDSMGRKGTCCSAWNPQPTVRYQEYKELLQANMVVNEAVVYLCDLECQLTATQM